MDVLNLSLGGTHNGNSGNNDLLAMALDNTVDAGLVVAVAAGNSGPGPDTIWSPGRARKVITVGASTNQHFVGQPFTYPAGGGTTIGAFVGGFPALPTGSYDLFDTHSTSCSSVDPGASGKLAIVDSGACTFSTQVRNAIAVGAVGVLFVFNNALDPGPPGKDGLGGDNLPAVLIGGNEGVALRASGATTASADDTRQEFITPNKDILLGLSSQGPTTVDLAIKPDLTSVGVLVLSSITCVGKPNTCPGDGTGWAFFTGTSMSTPHIAGSAAVPAGSPFDLVARASQVGARQSRRLADQGYSHCVARHRTDSTGCRSREPLRSGGCDNVARSRLGEFRQGYYWASDVVNHNPVQPHRHRRDIHCLEDEVHSQVRSAGRSPVYSTLGP